MTKTDMDYLLSRFGRAFLAAGNSLIGTAPPSTGDSSSDTGTDQPAPEDIVIDNSPAMGQVGVIANRAPLRTEPTKAINVDLGRLLEGEKVPLDDISEDKEWYRVDVRGFAGVHGVPDHATYAWGEASNFEIIALT